MPLPVSLEASVRQQLARISARVAFSRALFSTFEDLASVAFAGHRDNWASHPRRADAILERIRACKPRRGRIVPSPTVSGSASTSCRRPWRWSPGDDPVANFGVGFALNPISGNIARCWSMPTSGLVNRVVSGEGAIDQFVLARDGSLLGSAIGEEKPSASSTLRDCAVGRTVWKARMRTRASMDETQPPDWPLPF
ncbi:MAG: hypothetical protein IPM27_11560 [Nitrosomonadales bacterium]|nr:hypothetical protein [Nitrosomonadales bacterium]